MLSVEIQPLPAVSPTIEHEMSGRTNDLLREELGRETAMQEERCSDMIRMIGERIGEIREKARALALEVELPDVTLPPKIEDKAQKANRTLFETMFDEMKQGIPTGEASDAKARLAKLFALNQETTSLYGFFMERATPEDVRNFFAHVENIRSIPDDLDGPQGRWGIFMNFLYELKLRWQKKELPSRLRIEAREKLAKCIDDIKIFVLDSTSRTAPLLLFQNAKFFDRAQPHLQTLAQQLEELSTYLDQPGASERQSLEDDIRALLDSCRRAQEDLEQAKRRVGSLAQIVEPQGTMGNGEIKVRVGKSGQKVSKHADSRIAQQRKQELADARKDEATSNRRLQNRLNELEDKRREIATFDPKAAAQAYVAVFRGQFEHTLGALGKIAEVPADGDSEFLQPWTRAYQQIQQSTAREHAAPVLEQFPLWIRRLYCKEMEAQESYAKAAKGDANRYRSLRDQGFAQFEKEYLELLKSFCQELGRYLHRHNETVRSQMILLIRQGIGSMRMPVPKGYVVEKILIRCSHTVEQRQAKALRMVDRAVVEAQILDKNKEISRRESSAPTPPTEQPSTVA